MRRRGLPVEREPLVWRFPRYQNEIKNGARLVVRPGQLAIFVNEGTIADVFEPGTHELITANLPILSTLKGWKYGFEAPHPYPEVGSDPTCTGR